MYRVLYYLDLVENIYIYSEYEDLCEAYEDFFEGHRSGKYEEGYLLDMECSDDDALIVSFSQLDGDGDGHEYFQSLFSLHVPIYSV